MVIDLSPSDLAAIRRVWPTAGPVIKGTLDSFKAVFEKHPNEEFTGERIANIASLVFDELEKTLGVAKEDNGHQTDTDS
jgi:hypothetical protein